MYRGTIVSMEHTIMLERTLPGLTPPVSLYLLHMIGASAWRSSGAFPSFFTFQRQQNLQTFSRAPRHFPISRAPRSIGKPLQVLLMQTPPPTVMFWLTISHAFIAGLSGPFARVLGCESILLCDHRLHGASWETLTVLATGPTKMLCKCYYASNTLPRLVNSRTLSIPPRTCLSQELWQSFEDMSNVRPARDRAVLATFKGTPWGTGSLNRARLQCSRHEKWRTVIPGGRLHSDGPVLTTLWGVMGDYDYMGLLNDTIFCPQPAGTTGEFLPIWILFPIGNFFSVCNELT